MTARHGAVRRRLANPIASVILAVVLLLDLFSLPDDVIHRRYSAAARWTTLTFNRFAIPTYHPPDDELIAVYENGAFRRLHPEEDSWDEATRLLSRRPQDMVHFIATYTDGESGFWAPTHHERRVRLISTVGSAIPPAAAATLRDSFLSEFGFPSRLTPAARAALTATGLGHDERPVWSGYVHNVLSLVALALLVISLRWVPDAISGGRAARRARSLAQERCPRCGYSIRDLPEPKCPECGEALEWSPQTALRKATE